MTRVVGGVERNYLNLLILRSNLTVSVPEDAAEEVGLREVLSPEGLQEVLEVLKAPSEPFDKQWSRRMKSQRERLLLGDLNVTAGVVRDLMRRDLDGGLSPAEKDLLRTASEPLLGEIAVAQEVSHERAEEILEAAVTGKDVPTAELAAAQ